MAFEKGMNSSICLPAMSKQKDRLDFVALVWQPVYENDNSEFKPVLIWFKKKISLYHIQLLVEVLSKYQHILFKNWTVSKI